MTIVYIVETDLQRKLLTLGEKIGPCQKLFLDSRPSNIGVVKSFSQFAFSGIAC
jgi:hypothetical protein